MTKRTRGLAPCGLAIARQPLLAYEQPADPVVRPPPGKRRDARIRLSGRVLLAGISQRLCAGPVPGRSSGATNAAVTSVAYTVPASAGRIPWLRQTTSLFTRIRAIHLVGAVSLGKPELRFVAAGEL